jgi:hypothetical protein
MGCYARCSLVDGVVLPPSGLLDADSPPFLFREQPVLWAFARYLGRQYDMPGRFSELEIHVIGLLGR